MSLIGRNSELQRILSVVRTPRESALTIVGRQGIGKSALLSEIPRLSEHRTVFLRSVPAESQWAFSGLASLLDGINDPRLSRLADDLLRGSGTMDVAAVSTLVLDGLHQRPSARTVIVIDDADLLDAASQAVIGFLARRLAGTEVVLVASLREESPASPFNGLPALPLQALTFKDTVRMLELIPSRHAAAAAHSVAAASRGNPLAAVELYRSLVARQSEGTHALPVPLYCRSSFDAGYADMVGSLTPAARHVLDLVSLSFRSETATLEKACAELWMGLDELVSHGMVSRTGQHVQVPDQLLRGYLVATMPPASRSASHRNLAAAAGESDLYSRMWHQSFSMTEHRAPSSLLRFAAGLIRTGELSFGEEFIERALSLGSPDAEMAARLTTVAELLFTRGEFAYAGRYLQWAQRITQNPALILRLGALAFEIQFAQGTAVRSGMVLRLVRQFGRHDPASAFRLLAAGALYCAERWEVEDAVSLLRHSEEFRDAAARDCTAVADAAALLVETVRGNFVQPQRIREDAGGTMATLVVKGRALSYAGRHELARDAFAMVCNSDDSGFTNWRHTAACLAVDNEIRAGNVRKAVRLVDALDVIEPETKYHRGMRDIFRVWRAHSLGDETLAARCAAEALHFAGGDNHPAINAGLAAVQGHFALVRGNLADALVQLLHAVEIGMAFANPALLRCEPDLVEVLVRLGRHREATQVLYRLEGRSTGLTSPWLQAAVARSRAILADGEESLRLFRDALDSGNPHGSRFERARTLLCYAERLGAFGQLRDAHDGLLRAKLLFDEVGADAWTHHIDSLLLDARLGPEGTAADTTNPAMLVLTDHERALAQMVARGMRNKEIAAKLYVSVRTVEVRLTAIYRKLGVDSRAQLSALAAGRPAAPRQTYVLPLFESVLTGKVDVR